MGEINIFCLPFAGGNKYSYKAYEKLCPTGLKFITLEYPGRGQRLVENLMGSVDEIVEDMYNQIVCLIGDGKYAMYGHSMGAIIGFELIHKMQAHGIILPAHLFVTGRLGPACVKTNEKNWHQLSKPVFFQRLKELEGFPPEVFENNDLMDFVEPIIRSDFKVVETYQYQKRPPLKIPITVITGNEEPFRDADIGLWQNETVFTIDFKIMKGKHFFIFNNAIEVIQLIAAKLKAPPILYNGAPKLQ
jgi:surfactin synthase thioesterase subunit